MHPKILLFDFDGTIADTIDAAVRIYNEVAEEHGYTTVAKENLPALRNMGAMDTVRYLGISMLKVPFIAKHVRSMLRHAISDLQPIDGVTEALYALKVKGYRLYVVSSNSTENIKEFLARHKIEVFEDVFSVLNIFGKHTRIESLVREHAWAKESVLYIGDEMRDIEAAQRAGIGSIAVSWGYNTKEALLRADPDILITSPSELSRI